MSDANHEKKRMEDLCIKVSTGKVCLVQNEIVKLEFSPKVSIDLKQAKEIYKARLKLKTKEKKQLLLADFTTGPLPDLDARHFAKSEEVTSITHAMAILSNNTMGNILGNFFVGLNKPHFPTKLFSKEEQAIAWLRKMKKQ